MWKPLIKKRYSCLKITKKSWTNFVFFFFFFFFFLLMLSIIFFIHTFFSFITTKYFVSLAPFHFNSLFLPLFLLSLTHFFFLDAFFICLFLSLFFLAPTSLYLSYHLLFIFISPCCLSPLLPLFYLSYFAGVFATVFPAMGMSNFLYLFLFLSLLALNSLYLSYHLLFLFISIVFIFSLQSLLLCGYFRHCLPGDGYVELVEGEGDSLQVLAVLHPVDEVAAHDVRLVGEGVVRTEHLHKKYFGNIVIFKITNNPFCAAEGCRSRGFLAGAQDEFLYRLRPFFMIRWFGNYWKIGNIQNNKINP